jgi:hypothetical protein
MDIKDFGCENLLENYISGPTYHVFRVCRAGEYGYYGLNGFGNMLYGPCLSVVVEIDGVGLPVGYCGN